MSSRRRHGCLRTCAPSRFVLRCSSWIDGPLRGPARHRGQSTPLRRETLMPPGPPMQTIVSMSGRVFLELHPPLTAEDAVLEADRCLECGGDAAAPCVAACPAGIDVPAFVAAIAYDAPGAAARTIFAANLLGGTCARVCPVEELC